MAQVYYGKQQSANKVSVSATEVAERIKEVIAETGAEKVNIIAHSKGGLDSRYAISHLGMDKYVATLTTINTPHYGCKFVDMLLGKIPESIQSFVDGLVTVESGLYGENSKMIEHKGKRGISHGDVIDLFRENIKDFDVREFYVDIVKELKEQGF